MKRRLEVFAALVLAGWLTAGQTSAQKPEVARSAPTKKAMFWKASSPNNVIYLLGSIHLGSKDLYPLPAEIEAAFERSAALIVEVDINRGGMEGMQAMILSSGMYTGDDSLWNHVTPEIRAKLEQFCEKYGFPAAAIAKFKPWMAGTLVATLPLAKGGMEAGLGIDKYFLDKATAAKKRVVEAESAEWQIKLLSGFPDDVQAKYLASALEDGGKEKVKLIQDAWLSGDADKLDSMQRETTSMPAEMTKAMLYDRNPHMADVAEQFLKGKDVGFMVVGAAHMVGQDGIVRILEKRGYKVEQVVIAAR